MYSSFGDPNAQPPTPQQTPNSAAFASPVFETPKHHQGSSFSELGGLTPRFAEDYSVFNATPGNLRGTHGPFAEFAPATPNSASGHKRFLSAESVALEIASHATHFSPNPNAPLPPVDPSRRLPSSPSLATPQKETSTTTLSPGSPTLNRTRSAKKLRRGTLQREPEQTQILSPPPTAKKKDQRPAPKLNMQHDQSFGQPDFNDPSQTNEMAAMMGNPGDMFSYPLSAPAGGHANFWDPSTMSMDLDFSNTNPNMFHAATPGHRQTGSFDWNNNIQLFQDPNQPPPSSNQENVHPSLQQGAMMTNQQMLNQATTSMNNCSIPASYPTTMDDPFSMMVPGDGVDPGLLLSRPQSAAMSFDTMDAVGPTDIPQSVPPKPVGRGNGRKGNNSKGAKAAERAIASSPVKSTRPNLGRSFSENRGRKALGRGNLPTLAPATRPTQASSASGSGIDANRTISRSGGRVSPLKSQRRLSGLASIPEAPLRAQRRASVRFTIDAQGRARAETTLLADDSDTAKGISRSQSSRDLSFNSKWGESDDESTDEEPIIIPSRNNSFAASFALPDPRKPVGSIFHSSRRSTSDNSASNSEAGDATGRHHDGESDAETVLNDSSGGDAANELRKVMQGRQKRASQAGKGNPHRLLTNLGHFQDGTISPSSLTESGYGTDGQGVRCVCNRSGMGEGDGFMVQW